MPTVELINAIYAVDGPAGGAGGPSPNNPNQRIGARDPPCADEKNGPSGSLAGQIPEGDVATIEAFRLN